jgi:hypothetical protein
MFQHILRIKEADRKANDSGLAFAAGSESFHNYLSLTLEAISERNEKAADSVAAGSRASSGRDSRITGSSVSDRARVASSDAE